MDIKVIWVRWQAKFSDFQKLNCEAFSRRLDRLIPALPAAPLRWSGKWEFRKRIDCGNTQWVKVPEIA